ncbi:DoxX family protein [Tunicatimonas pelagia]|uniref:DoxX family protein n=1 Tax=Tunicatimonas pelagia TaxID=931531 RepID=UPI0026663019|nr:DoxX family protein [Tunicatimonas pelagia]WKN44851.1 DoxX family protein [Tunicatimonas pelagia]
MKRGWDFFLRPSVPEPVFQGAWLVYRVAIGLAMFGIHGLEKLTDFLGTVAHIPDPFGLGGTISTLIALQANVTGAFGVMLGLFTRLSALLVVGVTLVGLVVVHAHDPWSVKDVPLMYSLAFGLVTVRGGGRYAIDHRLYRWVRSAVRSRNVRQVQEA